MKFREGQTMKKGNHRINLTESQKKPLNNKKNSFEKWFHLHNYYAIQKTALNL